MSLINDALKKVSQAERGKPQPQPVDFETRAMQPAVYERQPQPLLWISIVLLAVVIAVATFFIVGQRQTTNGVTAPPAAAKVDESTKPAIVEANPVTAPVSVEAPKPQVAA